MKSHMQKPQVYQNTIDTRMWQFCTSYFQVRAENHYTCAGLLVNIQWYAIPTNTVQ